jgi:hypothetical protein
MESQETTAHLGKFSWVAASAIFTIIAGIIHLTVISEHWSHTPAHSLLFIVAGLMQVAWGISFWSKPTTRLFYAGMVLNGGLITLWAITRVLPAPFGHGPEAVDAWGIGCKLVEMLGIAGLIGLTASGVTPASGRRPGWRVVAVLLMVAFVGGWATYGVARAAEPLLPGLTVNEEEHDHSDYDHEEEDEHGHEH